MKQATGSQDGALALTALRWLIGLLFIAHLYWKFFVFPRGFEGWWKNFGTNGYPWFVPYYVFSAELAGAVLIIPGIWARWVALYAVPMMIGASHFWAVRNGFFFTAGGAELPVVWTALLAAVALLGDGAYALIPSPTPRTWKRREAPHELSPP
jgi:putative oxidoreductase